MKTKTKWTTKTIGDVCEIVYGKRVVRKKDGGSVYPVYGGGGKTFFMDVYNRKNCLVISRFAMSQKCVRFIKGKFFLNDSGLSLKIKNKNKLLKRFLNYQIFSKNDKIYLKGRGTAQKNLNINEFKKIKISFPSLKEQEMIVLLLDEVFEKLEKAEKNVEEKLKNVEELFESELRKTFNNKNWTTKTVEQCIEKVKNLKKVPQKNFLKVGKYPIISQEKDYINGYSNNKSKLFEITSPIVVFGDHTTILKYINFNFILGADGIKILKPEKKINPKFFYYALMVVIPKNIGYARHYKLLKKQNISFPSLQEQEKIVLFLDEVSKMTESLSFNYEKELKSLEELKKTVLKKALTESNV